MTPDELTEKELTQAKNITFHADALPGMRLHFSKGTREFEVERYDLEVTAENSAIVQRRMTWLIRNARRHFGAESVPPFRRGRP